MLAKEAVLCGVCAVAACMVILNLMKHDGHRIILSIANAQLTDCMRYPYTDAMQYPSHALLACWTNQQFYSRWQSAFTRSLSCIRLYCCYNTHNLCRTS
jgi:hypothetical protein